MRLISLAILPIISLAASPAAAQSDPAIDRVTVAAVLCRDAECTDLGDRLTGFAITAVDRTSGTALATCVTEGGTQSQACVLEIPAGARVP